MGNRTQFTYPIVVMKGVKHKQCSKCSILKSLDEFYRRGQTITREGHIRKAGLFTQCKGCTDVTRKRYLKNNRSKTNAYQVKRNKSVKERDPLLYSMKERVRESRRMAKEGDYSKCPLQAEELIQLWTGTCYVCTSTESVALDHCHTSGDFRGFLCIRCNLALGSVKDNPKTLEKLVEYLERSRV